MDKTRDADQQSAFKRLEDTNKGLLHQKLQAEMELAQSRRQLRVTRIYGVVAGVFIAFKSLSEIFAVPATVPIAELDECRMEKVHDEFKLYQRLEECFAEQRETIEAVVDWCASFDSTRTTTGALRLNAIDLDVMTDEPKRGVMHLNGKRW